MKKLFFLLPALLAALLFPALAQASPLCFGKKATIKGTPGPDNLRGTKAPDVIISFAGNDKVLSKDSKDTICTGPGNDLVKSGDSKDKIQTGTGNDRVFGGISVDTVKLGSGDDWIKGEEGSDKIWGGSGADTILGGNGGETVYGGTGNDRIVAGLLDDKLHGDAGEDIILGGHGGDKLYGDDGDDLLRGGVNYDHYYGGPGYDTTSFATAAPPGSGGVDGVAISNDWMSGDDMDGELRSSVERYIGSSFQDSFTASSGDFVDICGGDSCTDTAGGPVAFIDSRLDLDQGLVVSGTGSDDTFSISQSGTQFTINHQSAMSPGDGCSALSATVITCQVDQTLGFVMAYGGAGDDRISLGGGIAEGITVDLVSGEGNDIMEGSSKDDVILDTGGQDTQRGEGGSDALISTVGADVLLAGAGSDQLVTNALCYAHIFDGGKGQSDIAGFARVRSHGIEGGIGRGIVAKGVSGCPRIEVRRSNEIFEGTNQGDIMLGTSRIDYIIAREGNDLLKGFAGADELRGDEGQDDCRGGSGKDKYSGCERKS